MERLMRTLICLIFAVAIFGTEISRTDAEPVGQKAVLVTGASTGIGRTITELLASRGYFVYAGARKAEDIAALNEITNVEAIRLDVTLPAEISAAVETVRDGKRGLYGLVNNAGVASGGPLLEFDEAQVRWLFDVNIFGAYKVTQAFAPLIIESKGRISNISSIAGIVSPPFIAPYSMSKHAIEAYTDALAVEMAQFDIQVSIIEPGSYRTALSQSARERWGDLTDEQRESPYAEYYAGRTDTSRDATTEPHAVAEAVWHALFDDQPKYRYMVVPSGDEATWVISSTVDKLIQLNQEQEFSFSRDELVQMLDKSIEQTNGY
jgi:NAD(P)-dependent dehydrogenase (short-subunit alcohol dehydrogenase family)